MRRATLGGIVGAVMVATALAGCSNNSNTSSSGTSSSAAGAQTVTVAGQNMNVNGQTSCTNSNGNINIAVGDPTNGIGAVVSNANPPVVHSVGLGNANGITLGYSDAAPNQGSVQVSKNGNSYKISGTATGIDMSNPAQPVTKPFEMDVTCP